MKVTQIAVTWWDISTCFVSLCSYSFESWDRSKSFALSNGLQMLDVLGQERECSNMSSPSTPLMSAGYSCKGQKNAKFSLTISIQRPTPLSHLLLVPQTCGNGWQMYVLGLFFLYSIIPQMSPPTRAFWRAFPTHPSMSRLVNVSSQQTTRWLFYVCQCLETISPQESLGATGFPGW